MLVAKKLSHNSVDFIDSLTNDLIEVKVLSKKGKEIDDFDELLHVKTTKNFFKDLMLLGDDNQLPKKPNKSKKED